MKSLDQVLKAARQENRFSVIALHQRTTVPVAVIEALEAGEYDALPPVALVQGALQLLAEELDLDSQALLALYRRDGIPASSLPESPRSTRSWRQLLRYHVFSPRGLSWGIAGGVLGLAIIGVSWQWWHLSQPPMLEVAAPEENAVLTNPVTVQGHTQSENTITLNTEVVSIDPEGNFSVNVNLPAGERTLVIEATDQRGRTRQVVRFIRVE